MDTNAFDQRLKNALDGLDVPYDPTTWSALEQRLDALPAPVDTAVGPALAALDVPYDPSTWAALELRLDALPAPIDDAVGPTLATLDVPYDPATWAALEQRLDALPEPVDAAVRPALEGLEAPYQPGHWTVLAERMEYYRLLRWRLGIAKTLEAALLILLLLEFGGVWRHQPMPWWTPPTPAATPKQPVAALERSIGKRAASNKEKSPAVAGLSNEDLAATQWPATAGSLPNLEATWPEIIPQPVPEPLSANPAAVTSAPALFNSDLGGLLAPLPGVPRMLAPRSALEPIALNGVPTTIIRPRRSPFYANMYAAAEQHRIRTESDDVVRRADGYSAGMLAGYRRGTWTVEAGFGYAHRAYEPKRQIEIYAGNLGQGYWGSALTGVSTDMLTVPVRVLRRVAKVGGASAHVVAGATGQLALQKDYGYRSVYYPGTNPGGPGNDLLPSALPANRVTGRGVAEGGTLTGNVYATVDAGLRLEQNIGRRFAAYVEPTYRVGVAGRGDGPKRSRTNSIGVQVGLLARL